MQLVESRNETFELVSVSKSLCLRNRHAFESSWNPNRIFTCTEFHVSLTRPGPIILGYSCTPLVLCCSSASSNSNPKLSQKRLIYLQPTSKLWKRILRAFMLHSVEISNLKLAFLYPKFWNYIRPFETRALSFTVINASFYNSIYHSTLV